MFWIGVVDIAFKLLATRRERRALKRGALFPPKRREKESLEKVDDYLVTIRNARDVRGQSTYLERLEDALNFLKYGGSPDDLDQELRFLADDAVDRRDVDYGMIRTFVWAIPILGFLGTVLGITVALGSLDLTQLETTGESLAAGLKVAFDTTALALSLVFALYFLQFFSPKQDGALAASVSRLVDSELKGRFQSENASSFAANDLDATRRFLQSVAGAFEEATRAQTDLWGETMANAAQKSAELAYGAANRFGEALDKRLADGSAEWTRTLTQSQREFVEKTVRPALEEAYVAGVPVIVVDTPVKDRDLVSCSVLSDNYEAGVLCGKHLLSIRDSANILLLEHVTAESGKQRIRGFLDTIRGHEGFNVLGEGESDGQIENAMMVMEKLLKEHPEADTLMALNDPSAFGGMAAIRGAGLTDRFLVYGVDGTPEAKGMVKDGMMTATRAQFPLIVSERTVEQGYRFLREDISYGEEVIVPVELITRDNVDRFNINGWQ